MANTSTIDLKFYWAVFLRRLPYFLVVAALFTAVQELVDTYGEEAVAQYASRLPERIRCGEFSCTLRQ